ncbi:FAD-binding oxidoreductase [Pseudalkalibacillus caeni]|uniref:FAD-binding protein n=1 Tax=Exobacillus caeni TaxID=2574798 RepID=A0A5R9FAH7_9BACL|nr:FAD-linked oxidase C-terminal domain-containing protein [Pseudalkalibacillus caeni]TLS37873.1 FAD-binding protein [Pseudalkalibacillus caeni]
MANTQSLIEQLHRIVKDASRVIVDHESLVPFKSDYSSEGTTPLAVVFPITTKEASEILLLANQYKTPVFPRGRGTSLSGGPVPVVEGIIMDSTKWTSTLEIDPNNLIAVASPGVITADIDKAASKHGLMYPPDPSSLDIATIAGNVAENAGGPRGLKYGVTGDYVLGLEIVTPEGKVMKTGGKTMKNVTGYDLTGLITGSEGTLAVVSQVTLKLIPRPKETRTLSATFEDMTLAGNAVSAVLQNGLLPSKLEFIDQACIKAVEKFEPMDLPVFAEALLLAEVDGTGENVQKEIDEIALIFENFGGCVTVAKNETESNRLWKARKLVSPAIKALCSWKLSEDATVPVSQIPAMIKRLKTIGEKYNVPLVVFGHAGDGNLHPNLLLDKEDAGQLERAELAVKEIFQSALELGGTLSGEHGIGMLKSPFLKNEVGETGIDMMRRIKKAWDPNNILNPGKIFSADDNL